MNFSHKGIQNRKHQLESAATHRLHKLQLIGIRLTLIGLIFVSLFAGSFLIGMYTSILSSTPDVNSIQIVPKGYTTTIVDSEGNPIQSLVGKISKMPLLPLRTSVSASITAWIHRAFCVH